MNSKRKAEIQRKLSLASVPKPPAGLSDRIKADIPKYLKATEAERRRQFSSMSLNMRVAASILLLVTSLFVTMQLMSPEEQMQSVPAPQQVAVHPAPKAGDQILAVPQDEVRVEIAQQAPAATTAAVDDLAAVGYLGREAPRRALAEPEQQVAKLKKETQDERRRDEESVVAGVESVVGEVMGGVPGGVVGGVVGGVIAPAPAVPPPPPVAMAEAAAPPPPAEPPVGARPQATAPVAPSPAFLRSANAAELKLGPQSSVFGISVDPEVFRRIKTTLESGRRPTAESVNVAALVNYFAGAPARAPKRDVTLEVEGSPAPVGVEGRRGVLRFTIDTAAANTAAGSVPPIAKEAAVEIEFNRAVVTSFRPVFGIDAMSAEPALLRGMSVTGLYEVELRPGISSRERVATVRLRYRTVSDGKLKTITRELRGRDFANQWNEASRRHRLASLGAVWGETLKGTAGGPDVAKRAEELATQSPNDDRARELAKLATASVRLRGGAPTGSGR